MSAVVQICRAEAELLGQCPECGGTLRHHWGRHTQRWKVCRLSDRATTRYETADEAREAFLAGEFQINPRAMSADELVRLRSTWRTVPEEPGRRK